MEGILHAAQCIHEGGVVAFPTETVYGLGANALDADACRKIYKYKGRPLRDPLIVHVNSFEDALKLWKPLDSRLCDVMKRIAFFWPGPLTIIYESAPCVPEVVTAGSGAVGVRVPKCEIARELIDKSGVPIAAPSANKYGHVSPTTISHVQSDFDEFKSEIFCLDGGASTVGIESTVIRFFAYDLLTVVRKGVIKPSELQNVVGPDTKVVVPTGTIEKSSPGQDLTHYAPYVPTFKLNARELGQQISMNNGLRYMISQCALIDFGGEYARYKNDVLSYHDLSQNRNCLEAMSALFSALRDAENVPYVQCILVYSHFDLQNEWESALYDRINRSSSGLSCEASPGIEKS